MKRFWREVEKIGLLCIKWRYLIAAAIFVFCVVFQIHGSSIAEYNNLFENSAEYNEESIILGKSRTIRGDEWAVSTPYFMSQQYNDFNKNSNMMSLEGQDMAVAANSPILDITLLSKPFIWGYLLFGNDYGLSWYWCMKVILLVLMSFEFCMVITKRNKLVSLLGAFLIGFAPPIQWWFGIIDIFVFGMILFLIGYYFFTTKKRWQKNLYAILAPFVAMAFVLPMYPALMIPLGLFYLMMLIAVLIRDKNQLTFSKIDIWRIAGVILVFLGLFGYFIISSWEGISRMMNTSYPGRRVLLGGDSEMKDLFTNMTTFALPFKEITYSNSSEMSTFIQFAPIFLVLYPIIYKKTKRNRNIIVGNALVGCIAFVAVYMFIGFPDLLAKLSLFSMVNRIELTYGFIATIFTIWAIGVIWNKKLFTHRQVLIVLLIYAFLYICFVGEKELSYFGWKYYIGIIIVSVTLSYLMLMNYKKMFLCGMAVVIIATGFTVNPIAKGLIPLTGHNLEMKIGEIVRDDSDAYWLAVDNNYLAPIGIANGARVLNMVNYYPDYGKWDLVDPEKKEMDIYNRYAHINIELTEDETKLEPGIWSDAIKVSLSCEDLDKWGVKYLLIEGELDVCKHEYVNVYDDPESDFWIYRRN